VRRNGRWPSRWIFVGAPGAVFGERPDLASQRVVRGEDASGWPRLWVSPEDQRTAVILKHFHDQSLAQIAEQMDRSTLAVAGLLNAG